jgi:TolB-like protein
MNRMMVGGLVLALGYFALDKFVLAPRRDAERAAEMEQATATAEAGRAAAAPAKSIAVLPFANLSGDAKYEYLSDGMTEEILNALAQVPGLKVVARTSAFAFKGKGADLRDVGETLGVANVLEGSVQSDGDSVRVTAQLIDAKTGFHVWSEKYDRKLTSVFAIEDEICARHRRQAAGAMGRGPAAGARRHARPRNARVVPARHRRDRRARARR